MSKDRYPYEATRKSLTPRQQKAVTRRANKAKLPIPDILALLIQEEAEKATAKRYEADIERAEQFLQTLSDPRGM